MSMNTSARRLGVVVASALSLVTLTLPAASAGPAAWCEAHEGKVCLRDENSGATFKISPVPSGSCRATIPYHEMLNFTGYHQRKWQNNNCTGESFLVAPGRNVTGNWQGRSVGGL
ncbi:hypothetical protein JOF53_000116 [Crossiella equi]|uniref:Secreted protein n=1 Tax=Crossiella equi TaxID=130796 RepID=A0ABS5A3T6_9PSEU|nr:hypothetical protein [Crossiella equi]MBP2471244.1 hypothetical protein [Crossiella equi]